MANEKQFIKQNKKIYDVEEYISHIINKAGYSHTEIHRTPLGEKVSIHTSKPGLIVGRGGASIRELTKVLKDEFKMENPQIEVVEIDNPNLNPQTVARYICHTFERFGPRNFKSIGYKVLESIIAAGALGAEIIISGRGIPGERSKSWRFSAGHLKKSGNVSEKFVKRGLAVAHLKSGAVGIKIEILLPDTPLPDEIKEKIIENKLEEVKEEIKEEPKKKEKSKKETEPKTKKTTERSVKDAKEKEK